LPRNPLHGLSDSQVLQATELCVLIFGSGDSPIEGLPRPGPLGGRDGAVGHQAKGFSAAISFGSRDLAGANPGTGRAGSRHSASPSSSRTAAPSYSGSMDGAGGFGLA
jgi:hypothetical protein